MFLNELHSILFNAHILFSLIMGVWAAVVAGRGQSLAGNFWGAVATYAGLAAVILLVGIVMTAQGMRPERTTLYYLYMAYLVVIMPGLFSLLHGRDDRSAAIAFAILAFFNASTSYSMIDRNVIGPWV
jgi:hypothetical protein